MFHDYHCLSVKEYDVVNGEGQVANKWEKVEDEEFRAVSQS